MSTLAILDPTYMNMISIKNEISFGNNTFSAFSCRTNQTNQLHDLDSPTVVETWHHSYFNFLIPMKSRVLFFKNEMKQFEVEIRGQLSTLMSIYSLISREKSNFKCKKERQIN